MFDEVIMQNPMSVVAQDIPVDQKMRNMAQNYIRVYYQEWDQLNILRKGDAKEIAKMGTFIDAVRSWSNGVEPDMAALHAIKPLDQ
ncbi:hypothetical protein ACFFU8_03860 [Chromobacterium piscinae]|uniref:hypothetical protein n=1 Tax=Chromobacterium piscinae TaxID=686831 RepID=UPI00140BDB85|nr:hypothetical protein [Chromobacterium piscinae]MBX9299276.1 hypothetical protein [Chromobacterium vaccinii]MBX9359383.1 hypothetical protein [Chromobacterium vaccinii]MCD4503638.1 hypothetical protein [Chromobacterium piscinae]MCD5326916.1 hypothetical protein [Chromobacterium piscinae]NHQ83638.1 hypothetical protein [Chromobacterium vaccinii]